MLFSLIFTINVGIGTYFVYYKYMNRNKMFLDMIMSIKQQIINNVSKKTLLASDIQMGEEVKQKEITNRTYYFYNNIINLKNFESNLLKKLQKTLQKH